MARTNVITIPIARHISFALNGSQLAKMKKVNSLRVPAIPAIPAIKFIGSKQLAYPSPLYFKNYDFCEYVKFGAIS